MKPVGLRDNVWITAKVLQRLDERSRAFRRNRIDIRKMPDDSKLRDKDLPAQY